MTGHWRKWGGEDWRPARGGAEGTGPRCGSLALMGRKPRAVTHSSPQTPLGGNTVFSTRNAGSLHPAPRPKQPQHLLHGLEQRLPVILERHDELELRAPRLHGCKGEGKKHGVTRCPQAPPSVGWRGRLPLGSHGPTWASGCGRGPPFCLGSLGFPAMVRINTPP